MVKRYLLLIKILSVLVVFLSSCYNEEEISENKSAHMKKLTESDWIRLSEKKIFFGHQSVGNNIMDGILTLKNESNSTTFVILETKDSTDFQKPLFAHARIGKNLDPKSKIVDFVNILENGLGDVVDIAFMKLCYIDINNDTDVRELFEYYLKSLNSLQTKYPDLKIIHFTVPLTIKSKGIKGLAKVILKRDDNINRNKFNELMKNQFDQNELFDIAGIESTFPDGSSYRYVNGIPGLIPEYSSDGRHLNQDGKVLVARELVRKLLMND